MKKAIIGTVAVAVVAGLGFGGWWYYDQNIIGKKYIEQCKNEIKQTLNDPYSVVWEWEKVEKDKMFEGIYNVYNATIKFNAKNAFWAYTWITEKVCTYGLPEVTEEDLKNTITELDELMKSEK